jgi:hypothetical protein
VVADEADQVSEQEVAEAARLGISLFAQICATDDGSAPCRIAGTIQENAQAGSAIGVEERQQVALGAGETRFQNAVRVFSCSIKRTAAYHFTISTVDRGCRRGDDDFRPAMFIASSSAMLKTRSSMRDTVFFVVAGIMTIANKPLRRA